MTGGPCLSVHTDEVGEAVETRQESSQRHEFFKLKHSQGFARRPCNHDLPDLHRSKSPSRKVRLPQASHVSRFFCSHTSHGFSEQECLTGLGFATAGLSSVSCFSQTTGKVHVSAALWKGENCAPCRPVPLAYGTH